MSITVNVPTQLRSLTGGLREVRAEGATLAAVIADLERRHPGLRDRILDERGVRRFINLFVNAADAMIRPSTLAKRSGAAVNEVMPSMARLIRFTQPSLLAPARRGSRS